MGSQATAPIGATELPHKNDAALVDALLSGDRASFTLFYNAHFPRLFRFCRARVNDTEACKDIVQQSLANAMRSLHTYRGEASLNTWLCQIGRNEISAWYKKTGQHTARFSSLEQHPELISELENSTVDELDEISTLVQTCLDSLPSSYGKVLELKYIEGLSVDEIATIMQTGNVAIQSLLARARTAFKQAYSVAQKNNFD
jgi:RNA polymerase sigma-70 factor, ECF subfamily